MSEKKTDKPEQTEVEQATADSQATPSSTAKAEYTASAPSAGTSRRSSTRSMTPIYLVVLLVLIVLGAALWYMQTTQKEFKNQFEQRLQTQLSSSEQSSQKLHTLGQSVEQSLKQLKQANEKIALLEEQVHDLSQALQTVTDSGSELMLLNDVAHFIDLAQQQLLVGNVRNAIIPLETAQARLVRSGRQSLAILLQAINGDLDRLRAVNKVDTAETIKQLETLLIWLTEAPLLAPQNYQLEILQPEKETALGLQPAASSIENQEWWEEGLDVAQNWAQRAWKTMKAELAELVTVRRVDDATVLLMTPEQVQGLREHIRLRVSMAQLALLTRQNEIWQMELDTLLQLVEKRFDLSNTKTQRALGLIRELKKIDVQPELPALDNTLAAVESLRQKAAQQAIAIEQHDHDAIEEMFAQEQAHDEPTAVSDDAAPLPADKVELEAKQQQAPAVEEEGASNTHQESGAQQEEPAEPSHEQN